ncbi:SDR family NAD(P)-dependent oxidoreductase, partial [Ferrovibrio sp.]|uniref:SDR family NAD(P)-dependent oxidoreductase n=1 Tax=Ferrovibrio sp. TaxID=1917215 RepID=UPI002630B91D
MSNSGLGRILVTGAGGFIGSHLVEHLLADGHDVRALCHYNGHGSLGWLDALAPAQRERMEITLGDIRDRDIVEQAVRGCDTVFHLAALISIPYSYRAAESYSDTNLRGTINVLEAARRYGVQRIVQTSTSEVYGTAQFVPMTEEHPLSAQSPYAASKIASDQMALAFHRSHGVPVTILRPFNTFGPRQSPRAVIPTVMLQAAAGAATIRLGSVEPTRDFTYVADTASAFVAVAQAPDAIGEVINAGSGREISIGDLARLILDIAGS